MYQSLELEPEGAICPKRSKPQALRSSPHDTLPVSITGWKRTYKAFLSCRESIAVATLIDRTEPMACLHHDWILTLARVNGQEGTGACPSAPAPHDLFV
jgi:hypothetical protein